MKIDNLTSALGKTSLGVATGNDNPHTHYESGHTANHGIGRLLQAGVNDHQQHSPSQPRFPSHLPAPVQNPYAHASHVQVNQYYQNPVVNYQHGAPTLASGGGPPSSGHVDCGCNPTGPEDVLNTVGGVPDNSTFKPQGHSSELGGLAALPGPAVVTVSGSTPNENDHSSSGGAGLVGGMAWAAMNGKPHPQQVAQPHAQAYTGLHGHPHAHLNAQGYEQPYLTQQYSTQPYPVQQHQPSPQQHLQHHTLLNAQPSPPPQNSIFAQSYAPNQTEQYGTAPGHPIGPTLGPGLVPSHQQAYGIETVHHSHVVQPMPGQNMGFGGAIASPAVQSVGGPNSQPKKQSLLKGAKAFAGGLASLATQSGGHSGGYSSGQSGGAAALVGGLVSLATGHGHASGHNSLSSLVGAAGAALGSMSKRNTIKPPTPAGHNATTTHHHGAHSGVGTPIPNGAGGSQPHSVAGGWHVQLQAPYVAGAQTTNLQPVCAGPTALDHPYKTPYTLHHVHQPSYFEVQQTASNLIQHTPSIQNAPIGATAELCAPQWASPHMQHSPAAAGQVQASQGEPRFAIRPQAHQHVTGDTREMRSTQSVATESVSTVNNNAQASQHAPSSVMTNQVPPINCHTQEGGPNACNGSASSSFAEPPPAYTEIPRTLTSDTSSSSIATQEASAASQIPAPYESDTVGVSAVVQDVDRKRIPSSQTSDQSSLAGVPQVTALDNKAAAEAGVDVIGPSACVRAPQF